MPSGNTINEKSGLDVRFFRIAYSHSMVAGGFEEMS